MSSLPDEAATTLSLFKGLGSGMMAADEYSDLTLKCKDITFKVHRIVVCVQSKPLAACVKEGWKGSETGEIILDDDPKIVAILVNFFYSQTIDLSAGTTDTPAKGPAEEDTDETLLNITKVYVIADKYDIPALKNLAVPKFQNALLNLRGTDPEKWADHSLPKALKLMYEETPQNDRALKDVAVEFAAKPANGSHLLAWMPFRAICLEIGEIAVDMWMVPAEPVPKVVPKEPHCPDCRQSQYVYYGHVTNNYNYCYSCQNFFAKS